MEGTMLVLCRRIGETIVINGNIQVKVLSVQGNKVRLGVVAPEDVSVDREEVHERRNTFAEGTQTPEEALVRN
jgi:carbon storage regulator